MALYAIGDLHLSLGTDKPMDVFGGEWDNYVDKLTDGFKILTDEDTCVLCGDVSWGMTLEESLPDFKYIDALPGKKIILKGNHDYWWTTATKIKNYFEKNRILSINILFNNSYRLGETAICGTRSWFYEPRIGTEHDKKIMAREVLRLEASLKAAGDAPEKICFFHYPPIFKEYVSRPIIDLMKTHGVKSCWYGHIHGQGHRQALTGEQEGIMYHMVSADYVGFKPVKVI